MSVQDSKRQIYLVNPANCLCCDRPHITSISEDGGDTSMLVEKSCANCSSEWEDRFVLTDVTLDSGGTLGITKLSELQKTRYLEHGQACPICQNTGEDNELGLSVDEFQASGTTGNLEVMCHRCLSAWTDHYKLYEAVIINNATTTTA